MLLFMRFLVVLFFFMFSLYAVLAFSMRERQRASLKGRWMEQGCPGERAAFVREGLERYDASFVRKLLHLAYVMPPAVVLLVIYIINFQ